MKNINLLKNLAVLSLLVLPTLSYSATQPAISISRANCYAPFPNICLYEYMAWIRWIY